MDCLAPRHQLSVGVAVVFRREVFVDRHKTTKFPKVFSLEGFPLCMVPDANFCVVMKSLMFGVWFIVPVWVWLAHKFVDP